MKLIILGLLLVLAVLALMVYIKRRRVSKAATIVRNSGETIVDEAMGFVAEQMRSQGFVLVTKRGTSVADVWGQAVVGFNYKIKLNDQGNFRDVGDRIDYWLTQYCQRKDLMENQGPMLRVSDLWANKNILEVDVVYLINEQTKNYLKDLSKL
ncbi:hypothetical protein QY883_04145 [Pediococcus acidilactici]|uniref:hypothetical protein n=1 Tax=Pediococcus acidilactici TaxID=1254 RepID=UPI000326ED24|nr:hypothetical protein [Pediococcus acidilactici]EOA08616.1 hypothetical protein PAD3_1218 [Pediococcus acidilactici D3]MBW4797024.1 hypothetical protein [Pediococcus acidilactici]MBW9306279.1 hypothetical protein [Pediococcus acidilactici]MCE5961299.1 hypothetical protein [Pediococcus acidilactici]MCW8082229.1 hypothetical protein [Pediococcus acidilactici]